MYRSALSSRSETTVSAELTADSALSSCADPTRSAVFEVSRSGVARTGLPLQMAH